MARRSPASNPTRCAPCWPTWRSKSQRPHSRDALAALLWPDWPDSAARSNLRYALADLRKVIRDQGADPPFLLISRDAIQFNSASDHCLDVVEFGELGNHSGGMGVSEEHVEQLCQALALYRGEFLDGFSVPDAAPFEEWTRLKREQLHRQHLGVLGELATDYERAGDVHQALVYAWRQVEIEPWQESGQRQLMRLLALNGQRSAALAQYEACRRILVEELHAEPSLETTALYESIRDGRLDFQAGAPTILEELPPAPGVPPFMGLQYFDERDADLYYGRESLTARLVAQLNDLQAARFLAVVGASGSGKSSLVRAGLVPAIRKGEKLADGSTPPRWSHRWLVHVITPTAHPLESLATSLTREGGSVSTTAALIDDLGRDPRSLHLYARRMTHLRNAPRLLLVVDQLEELFTLCRSEIERGAFIDNLLVAAGVEMPAPEPAPEGVLLDQPGQDGPLIAVIALRADFYNHCAQYAGLRSALGSHQEFIGPMSPAELRRAIEEPARQNDWEFEPGLVDLILREVSDEPGALPLLSHALLETWERRRGRTLTLKGYAEAGGIHGAIAQTAESVYNSLSPEKRDLARLIFMRLTELGEGTQDTRRRSSVSELVPSEEAATQIEVVLNTLVDARLVTAGEGTVEVAHEALIREWPALRQWLDEDRESLRLHRHLTEAAQAWEAMDRDPGELYRGARLAQAAEWATQPENAAALNAQEREFLSASKEAEEREVAEQEAQRQRELEAAQRAAEAERRRAEAERQRAEEQTKSASRLRRQALYLVGVVLIALLMAGVAFVFANRSASLAVQNAESAQFASTQQAIAEAEANSRATQQAIAEGEALARATAEAEAIKERELAENQTLLTASRELALAAVNNQELDPELSILLALQALKTAHTPEAEDALHAAVQASRMSLRLEADELGALMVDFSPDGGHLATADYGGHLKVWDAQNGQELLDLPGSSVAFRPDGELLAAGLLTGTVQIYEAATGSVLASLDIPGQLNRLLFSPDGHYLAAASISNTVKLWETTSWEEHFETTAPSYGWTFGNNLAFTPDGSRLLVVDNDGNLKIWGVEKGNLLGEGAGFGEIAISPDGSRLATSSGSQGTIIVRDFSAAMDLNNQGRPISLSLPIQATLSGHNSFVQQLAFSPDGSLLASTALDGTARVWSLGSQGGEELIALTGHVGNLAGVDFSPDGRRLATAGADGSVRIWDIVGGELHLPVMHSQRVYSVKVSPDGRYLLTASWDGTARLWDFSTGKELLSFVGHVGWVNRAAFSPDGRYVATSGEDGTVRLWDLAASLQAGAGQEKASFVGSLPAPPVGGVYPGAIPVAFSPDGQYLLSGGADGMARVWKIPSGEEALELQAHPNSVGVTNAVFSPDGSRIATASDWSENPGTLVKIWDMSTGEELVTIPGRPNTTRIWALAFSPDGKRIATNSGVWDAETGEEIFSFTQGFINAAFSPDGKLLASVSVDGILRIWDAAKGLPLHTISASRQGVFGVAFTPDGRYVVTSGGDREVHVYTVHLEDLMALARARVVRGFTLAECQKYLHVETCPAEGI